MIHTLVSPIVLCKPLSYEKINKHFYIQAEATTQILNIWELTTAYIMIEVIDHKEIYLHWSYHWADGMHKLVIIIK
jgi:hypothetical protein